MAYFDGILLTLIYLAASFVLFIIGKFVFQLFHPSAKMNHELVEKDNFAFAVAVTGYYTGLILAIGAAVSGESAGLIADLIDIGMYGVLSIVLLNLSIIANDKIVLRKFSVNKEILEDRNVGTGVVQAANGIATGLIILGAVSGEGFGYGGPVVTVLLYWVLGQGLLLLTELVYNLITPYDIHEYIQKGNVAVGIGFAGALIAVANLIRNALTHDFVSWYVTLEDVGFEVVVGLAILPVIRFMTDKVLLPGQKLTDEIINQEQPNNGAAFIEAFAYIGGSFLICWAL